MTKKKEAQMGSSLRRKHLQAWCREDPGCMNLVWFLLPVGVLESLHQPKHYTHTIASNPMGPHAYFYQPPYAIELETTCWRVSSTISSVEAKSKSFSNTSNNEGPKRTQKHKDLILVPRASIGVIPETMVARILTSRWSFGALIIALSFLHSLFLALWELPQTSRPFVLVLPPRRRAVSVFWACTDGAPDELPPI